MAIEVQEFKQDILRKPNERWFQGFFVWKPARTASWGGTIPVGPVMLHSLMDSPAPSLKAIVAYYVAFMEAQPHHYPPGKYNVRIVDGNFERTSVTITVT